MRDQRTDIAKMMDNKPPTIPDLSALTKQLNLSSTKNPSLFVMLPDSIKAHVVQYLQFDDLVHEGKLKLDETLIPEDMMLRYMPWTDFDEPIRFIFYDFESTDIDIGRLKKLKILMKNVNFQSHHLPFWQSIINFASSFGPRRLKRYAHDTFLDLFVDWMKATVDCPSKGYVLSKWGNDDELYEILARGRLLRKYSKFASKQSHHYHKRRHRVS